MASSVFTRWFQSRVFTPGFCVHSESAVQEPWSGPAPSQRVLVDFIGLRRRLDPYVEATARDASWPRPGAISPAAGTSLRDYARPGDHLRGFLFGPSLLVQPAAAVECADLFVPLPADSAWFDFWTGGAYPAGQSIRVPAPLSRLPLFVRAGTILPLSAVDPTDPEASTLELRVYPGANGRVNLPDAGASAAGDAVTPGSISVEWDDHARVLRIGARPGTGAARPSPRRFYIVIVRPEHGVGHLPPPRPDKWINYDGAALRLSFPAFQPRPLPPVGLAAKVDGDRIHFTWSQSCEGVVYRLKRIHCSQGPFEDLASALLVPRCSIPLPAEGKRFSYVVTAMNSGGESPPSAPLSVAGASTSPPPRREGLLARGASAVPSPGNFGRAPGLAPLTTSISVPADSPALSRDGPARATAVYRRAAIPRRNAPLEMAS